MHLLNTKTKTLETFQGRNIPNYAILSHVWEEQEISFQDINDIDDSLRGTKGFSKITSACTRAINDGLRYLWVDTCCINKESSAELSEAINSMFTWYKNSQVCYAFLSDVPSDEDPTPSYSSFAMSKWFTRGWTLQELLAPMRVIFYGSDWIRIGTKTTLQKTITAITGIEERIILEGGSFRYGDVPIAVRMSWAAERRTTRIEDIAYCLMGLFDVNMPLLYGEGRKAFIRLQHEIIRKSNDQSIFAWKAEEVEGRALERGLLAHFPSEFYDSNKVTMVQGMGHDDEYAITNRGIRIKLVTHKPYRRLTVARLNCLLSNKPVGIYLEERGSNRYVRVQAHRMSETSPQMMPEPGVTGNDTATLFVLDDVPDVHSEGPTTSAFLRVTSLPEYGNLKYTDSLSWKRAGHSEWKFVPSLGTADAIFIIFNPSKMEQCAVAVGVTEGMVWADIFTDFEFNGNVGKVYASYFSTQKSAAIRKIGRGLDGSSVDLPSGWTAHLEFGIAERSLDGEVHQHMTVRFQKTITASLVGPTWKRPPSENEVIYLITCPAVHHGFVIVEEDLFRVTSHGYWPPQSNRSFIAGVPANSGAFIIPFRKGPTRHKEEFFLVLSEAPQNRVLKSSIEMKRPDIAGDVLQLRGKLDRSYSVQLEGGKLVSMARRCTPRSHESLTLDCSLKR